jgi:hypothetical protein
MSADPTPPAMNQTGHGQVPAFSYEIQVGPYTEIVSEANGGFSYDVASSARCSDRDVSGQRHAQRPPWK